MTYVPFDQQRFGRALFTARRAADMTQEDVARRASALSGISITSTYVHKLETGKMPRPGADRLALVAAALGYASWENLQTGYPAPAERPVMLPISSAVPPAHQPFDLNTAAWRQFIATELRHIANFLESS